MKLLLICPALLLGQLVSLAPADVFVLSGGGRITGDLVNRNESPRQRYIIQISDGAQLTLDASQVEKVVRVRPEEAEYERIYADYPDTADAQWELAQWCREHKLTAQREIHLRRVIELDPDHVEARRALGYNRIEGKWQTRQEVMTDRGYVRYKGQWKLPQEIELLENKKKLEAAQQEWFQKIKRWRGWLGTDRDNQGRDSIRSLTEPMAVKALTVGLRDDSDPQVRLLYIKALANIDTVEAARALAIAAVSDPVEEVRLTCLDYLQTKKRPDVIAYFVGKLKDKDNKIVNLAGIALGRMKDPTAVGPLIDALVTVHKFKISKPGGDQAMSTSFGSGGSGMSMGGGPKIIHQAIPNQTVLDALATITGRNFNFDKQAWKYWFAAQKKPADALDARRD